MTRPALHASIFHFAPNYRWTANYWFSDTVDIVQHYRISHTVSSGWNATVQRSFVFKGDTTIFHLEDRYRRLKWIWQP
jgi:hypothetical protein